MKARLTHILPVILFLFTVQLGLAQSGFTQYVGKRNLGGDDTTVFVLEVKRAIEKDMTSAWKKAIEKRNKVKSKTENGQTVIRDIVISSIGTDTLDIYSSIVQRDTSVVLYAAFFADDIRVDPNGKEGMSVKVRKLLDQFGVEVYREVLNREFEIKTERLKELAEERDENLKEQNDLEKDIQRDSLKIKTSETEIDLLNGQLQNSTDRYIAQKNKLSSIAKSDKAAIKAAKSDLKDIDKERKNIESEIEDNSDNIIENKGEIREFWYQLSKLKGAQEILDQQIEDQQLVVKQAENELRGLK